MEVFPMSESGELTAEDGGPISFLLQNPPPPTPKLLELFADEPLTEDEARAAQQRHDEWRVQFEQWKAARSC